MNADERRELLSLQRGLAILEAAGDRCPLAANSPAHAELRELVNAIDATDAVRHEHRTRTAQKVVRKRRLRERLATQYLQPLAALRAAYRDGEQLPPLPEPAPRLPDANFVSLCCVTLNMATPGEAAFVRCGLPAGFLDEMRRDVEELTELLVHISARTSTATGQRVLLQRQFERARDLRRLLTSLVMASAAADDALRAAWQVAMLHAERPVHRLKSVGRRAALPGGARALPPAPAATSATSAASPGAALALAAPDDGARWGTIARIVARARLLLPSGKGAA